MNWAMQSRGLSQRRACDLAGIAPRVFRYQSVRPEEETLRQHLRELANERRRFGYRRLHILLKREGWEVNHKKLYRLYAEERLDRTQARRSQAGTGDTLTYASAGKLQPAMVTGFCLRHADGWQTVPSAVYHR